MEINKSLAFFSLRPGNGFLKVSSKILLTTKFGNPRIGDEEETEMELEMEIVPETEWRSAGVRIGYD